MKSTFLSRSLLLTGVLLFAMLSCYGQDESSKQMIGTWTKAAGGGTTKFILTADDKYEVRFTGREEADVWGSYEIAGNKITFTDKGGDYSSGSSGVYEFKVSEKSIDFTEVNDPVDGRRGLVEGSWSKAGDTNQGGAF